MGHRGPMANAAPTMGAVNPLVQFAAMGPMGGIGWGLSPMSMAGHMNGMPGPMNGMSSMGNLQGAQVVEKHKRKGKRGKKTTELQAGNLSSSSSSSGSSLGGQQRG